MTSFIEKIKTNKINLIMIYIIPFLIAVFINGADLIWNPVLDFMNMENVSTSLSWALVMLVMIIIVFITSDVKNYPGIFFQKERFLPALKIILPWFVFLIYIFLSLYFNSDSFNIYNYGELKFLVFTINFIIPMCFIVIFSMISNINFKMIIRFVILFGMIYSLILFYNIIFIEGLAARNTILSINSIGLARYIAISIICVYITEMNFLKKNTLASILFIALVLTGSRGPLLAVIITLFVYLVVDIIKNKCINKNYVYLVLISLGIFIIISFVGFGANYFSRGSESILEERNIKVRLTLYKDAYKEYKNNRLTGVGLGNFSSRHTYPHNIILELLSETGLIGLILFLIAFKPLMTLNIIRSKYAAIILLGCISLMFSGDLRNTYYVLIPNILLQINYFNNLQDKKRYIT